MKRASYVAGIALSMMCGCLDFGYQPQNAGPDGGADNGIGTSPQSTDPADGIGTSPDGIGTSPDGIGTSPGAKDPGCRDSAGRCNDDGVGTSPATR